VSASRSRPSIRVKRAAGRPKDLEAVAELEAIRDERPKKFLTTGRRGIRIGATRFVKARRPWERCAEGIAHRSRAVPGARRTYDEMAGWDPNTGTPTPAKLAELGLEEVTR